MAFRSTNYYTCLLNRLRGGNATYATSTLPKKQAYTPAANLRSYAYEEKSNLAASVAEFTPVHVSLGLILLSSMLGLHTAKQQLLYSPTVRVKKKLRETIPEVVCPDKVVDEADNFIDKSFFRKVADV